MRILALLTALTATADAFAPCSRTTSSCNGNSMLGTVAARKMNSAPRVSTRGSASMLSLANPFLVAESAVATTTSSSTTEAMSPLMSHFLESLITNGVPALFSVIVIGFAALMLGKARKAQQEDVLQTRNPVSQLYEDLYGDQDPDGGMMGNNNKRGFLGRPSNDKMRLPSNAGVPALQYIKLTHLNRQWESYAYSLTAATQSKAAAAADYRATSFRRALGMALGGPVRQELLTAEADFLKTAGALSSQIVAAQARLTQHAVDEELEALGLTNVYDLDPAWNATAAANETSAVSNNNKKKKSKSKFNANEQFSQLSKWQRELQEVELDFIQAVIQAVGPANGAAVRAALLGDVAVRGSGGLLSALQDRPLRTLLMDAETGDSPKPGNVYVSRFPGDATASQVATLREEVTAIVQSAKPGDEALVILQTGGGTVTGYGLAAAQLMRFKDAGLKLTIAVEQVAASGGYMMACVADRIVASPFAVLGSIGVISDMPNVYERLKKEGIEFQTVTAGKYKRTLTPTYVTRTVTSFMGRQQNVRFVSHARTPCSFVGTTAKR